MAQPTPEQIKRGWTEETLTKYFEDQKAAEQNRIMYHSRGPVKRNGTYRHTWPHKTHTDSGYSPLRRSNA